MRLGWVESRAPGLLGELLECPYERWLRVIHRAHESFKEEVPDDPVPRHLQEALEEIEAEVLLPVVEELRKLPVRSNASDERLEQARRSLAAVMDEVWRLALARARFRSSLLILDEAHHLKNPATRLASLFVDDEAAKDSKLFERSGALGGKFDRMMFLTATTRPCRTHPRAGKIRGDQLACRTSPFVEPHGVRLGSLHAGRSTRRRAGRGPAPRSRVGQAYA